MSVVPKRLIKAGFLGLSSCQIGSNVNEKTKGLNSMYMFQAQTKHNEMSNLLPEKTLNAHHLLTLLTSQAN